MKSIHVLRKPCSRSAPTVAANVLRYGTGALNIGATRIKHVLVAGGSLDLNPHLRQGIKRGQSLNPTAFALGDNATVSVDPAGRWPANLILQHLDGCVQDGVKKVKASAPASGPTLTGASTSAARGKFNGVGSTAHHGDEDGNETVTAWACAEGCPVASLDGQSGVTKAVPRKPTGKPMYSTEGTSMVWNSNSVIDTTERGFTDTGGASRFFKQVGGRSE